MLPSVPIVTIQDALFGGAPPTVFLPSLRLGISKTAGGSLHLKEMLTRLSLWRIKKATVTTFGSIARLDSYVSSISMPPAIAGSSIESTIELYLNPSLALTFLVVDWGMHIHASWHGDFIQTTQNQEESSVRMVVSYSHEG